MRLNFSKMHGLGNDFVMVDGISQSTPLTPALIARIGDRRRGVGFDQLLQAVPADDCESGIGVRIFNTDGSEAEHCGNGMRCFARFLSDRSLLNQTEPFNVTTSAGPVSLELLEDTLVKIGMGVPTFAPDEIPLTAASQAESYVLQVGDESVELGAAAIGNPHGVLDVADVESAPVERLRAAVQASG